MYFRLSFQSFSHRSYMNMTRSRTLYFDVTMYTAISRKVVWKHVNTLQSREGNMGYDQYTVPDTVAVEPTFVAFLNRKHTSMACQISLKNSQNSKLPPPPPHPP